MIRIENHNVHRKNWWINDSLSKYYPFLQGPETWVGVRALRASSGGILDPDDRVRDVADDRETLTAECTGQAPQPRAAQADGASGSSAGTASPDMFRVSIVTP